MALRTIEAPMASTTTLEIDAVIDPAATHDWLAKGLASAKVGPWRGGFVDAW